jgi:glycogen debranching enzyme
VISLTRDVLNHFDAAVRREWLVTNGIGGFACGTLVGVNTRRYHGLLVASLRPPVERTVMVSKLDAVAVYRDDRFDLAANEYAEGAVAPHGYVHLESFRLEGSIPVWSWVIGDALLEQRVWMAHGANTTYVSYTLIRATAPLSLELSPLCTYRDYHAHHRGERNMLTTPLDRGLQIDAFWGANPYRVLIDEGEVRLAPEWWWNFRHREETARGLDDAEDLFRPALLRTTLSVGESRAVMLTAEADAPLDAASSLARERRRQDALANEFAIAQGADAKHGRCDGPGALAELIPQLALAADQFIVARKSPEAISDGPSAIRPPHSGAQSVIAGYPWFSDWGRDTMIALPGLTLSTGRYDVAASILRTFARFVSDGMLPNRFPDAGEQPEYNTVDAALWYFVAIDEYVRASADHGLLDELYPVLRSIVRWHQRGTRYGIRVDARDHLLRAGEPGAQLTWMDAKIGDWVVTPRIGKPVEINALWFNALAIMRGFAARLGAASDAREYAAAAERVARAFNERFWFPDGGFLYDVVDAPDGDDASLRPNQLFAISLRHALLENGRAKGVVDACARELWTPLGLRSLARSDSDRYAGRYVGGSRERDAVYHQGTVWSWLLGPFALAHYRVHGDASRALAYLDGAAAHLRDACIGQVSEIFDGDAPFTPRGCFAQAWGVAEILRAWSEINAEDIDSDNRSKAYTSIESV